MIVAALHEQAFDYLVGLKPQHGLYSARLDPRSGELRTDAYKLGAEADSFYEYALKLNIQSRESEPQYRAVFDAAVDGAVKLLLKKVRTCV
jgi:Glycosyl hydrolase family 47